MPKEPMKSRVIRVGQTLWDAAIRRSQEETRPRRVVVELNGRETVSEAVRKFLERFVR